MWYDVDVGGVVAILQLQPNGSGVRSLQFARHAAPRIVFNLVVLLTVGSTSGEGTPMYASIFPI